MVRVYLKGGASVDIPDGVAVAATDFPSKPGADQVALALTVVTADGKTLAVFRQKETAGYVIEPAVS
jgi:hypothetical protein